MKSPQYHIDHHWAKLPATIKPGYTHGVGVAGDGRIFIANQSPHAILILAPDGTYLGSWGEAYQKGAHGLFIHREAEGEFLYLSNTNQSEVVKTTLEGEVVWKIGRPPVTSAYSEDKKFSPTETTVTPDGTVYVADGYGQSYVHIHDREGRWLDCFGGAGSEPGKLKECHGIGVDSRSGTPTLLVANRANRRIDRFSTTGAFMETVIGPESLRYPCTAVMAGGLLYVPDLFARVSIFGNDNRLVTHVGDYLDGGTWDKPMGQAAELHPGLAGYPNIAHEHRLQGKFSSPHGLAVDPHGNIYVVEWISDGRITKLTPTG